MSDRHTVDPNSNIPSPPPGSAADNDVVRGARLNSLGVLLSRISNGLTLTPAEARLLVDHIDVEVRDSTTARTIAAQTQDLLRVANETSNRSETERASAVQRAERAEAVVARVRALHTARPNGTCAARCYSTGMAPEPWPCPTIRALDEPPTVRQQTPDELRERATADGLTIHPTTDHTTEK